MTLQKASSFDIYNEWDILGEEDWDLEKNLSLPVESDPVTNLNSERTLHTPPPHIIESNCDLHHHIPTVTQIPPAEIFDSPSKPTASVIDGGSCQGYSDQLTMHTKPFTKIQDEDSGGQSCSDSECVSQSGPSPPPRIQQGSQMLPTQAKGPTSDDFAQLTTFSMPKFMMYQVQQSMQNNLPAVIMPQPSVSTSGGMVSTTSTVSGSVLPLDIPNLTDMLGQYEFTVTVEEKERSSKSPMWLMSHVTRKLYTNINKAVPFEVHLNKRPADTSMLFVKVVPVFSSPQFFRTNVIRCPNHSAPTDPTNHDFPYPEYVVRADHPEAQYVKGPSGRLTVLVPLSHLQSGPDYNPILLRFMCLGSCVGGINRRPIAIVVTLENQQEVLGRKVIDVRVCACPTRDIKTDEQAAMGTKRKANSGQQEREIAPRKKSKMFEAKIEDDDDDQQYTIKVYGRKLYNFMIGMKELYYKTHPEYALRFSDPPQSRFTSAPSLKREIKREIKVKDIRQKHDRENTEQVDSRSWEMQARSLSNEDELQNGQLGITDEASTPRVELYVVDNPVQPETSTEISPPSSQAGRNTSSPVQNSSVTSLSTAILSRHIPVVPVTTYKSSLKRAASESKLSRLRNFHRSSAKLGIGQKLEVSEERERSISPASKEMLAADVLMGGFY